jgi:hypothetical protein
MIFLCKIGILAYRRIRSLFGDPDPRKVRAARWEILDELIRQEEMEDNPELYADPWLGPK